MDDKNEFTSSYCTIVDGKDHVQYILFQRAIPDNCIYSLTEWNIAINDHNDALIVFIGHYRYKTKHNKIKIAIRFC